MSDGFNMKLEGLGSVNKLLSKISDNAKNKVDTVLTDSTIRIANDARSRFQSLTAGFSDTNTKRLRIVKRSTGTLLNRISAQTQTKYSKQVVAQAKYAPYVEFGTGGLVEVPAGLEGYARRFKGRGVRKVNLPARPFMFPALAEEKPKLIKEIKNTLLKR